MTSNWWDTKWAISNYWWHRNIAWFSKAQIFLIIMANSYNTWHNVDHNILTLDGNNTFHGMGMINAVTPGTKSVCPKTQSEIRRNPSTWRSENTTANPTNQRSCRSESQFGRIVEVLSTLWNTAAFTWSGTMQAVHEGNHKGQSSINFLPMIDMNPSFETCISSTLNFVSEHAKRQNTAASIITFDQLLWWKAYTSTQSRDEWGSMKCHSTSWCLS